MISSPATGVTADPEVLYFGLVLQDCAVPEPLVSEQTRGAPRLWKSAAERCWPVLSPRAMLFAIEVPLLLCASTPR